MTTAKKTKTKTKSHEEVRKDVFRKGTSLASVIWERDEIADSLQGGVSCADWLNKITQQIGLIANQTEEKLDDFVLEDEIIRMGAFCLLWINQIRRERTGKAKNKDE